MNRIHERLNDNILNFLKEELKYYQYLLECHKKHPEDYEECWENYEKGINYYTQVIDYLTDRINSEEQDRADDYINAHLYD